MGRDCRYLEQVGGFCLLALIMIKRQKNTPVLLKNIIWDKVERRFFTFICAAKS